MHATNPTSFVSCGQRCAAWLTGPAGPGPHPGVVLAHGLGATHEMKLGQYEQAFADAGLVVLSFDYRHHGASEGEPRQLVSMRRQRDDVLSALDFLATQPDVDPGRLALWGTSLGATPVFLAAARHRELAAVIVQCPILHGPGASRRVGLRATLRVTPAVLDDIVRAVRRRPRRYVAIVGERDDVALVTAPGAKTGWESVMPPGFDFDNRVPAATGLWLLANLTARKARSIRCPLLVCVPDGEELIDPAIATRAAAAAPQGRALHLDTGHFGLYHPPLFDAVVAHQASFLQEHLRLEPMADAYSGPAR